jgi:hypothetical protein
MSVFLLHDMRPSFPDKSKVGQAAEVTVLPTADALQYASALAIAIKLHKLKGKKNNQLFTAYRMQRVDPR